jgi:tight adherence protein B
MELLLVAFIFIAVVLLIEGVFLLSRSWWNPETRRVKTQLRQLSAEAYGQGDVDLVRQRMMSEIPWFNRFLLGLRLPVIDRIERMVIQADLNYPVGVVLLASVVFAVLGFAAASYVTRWFPVWLAVGFLLGTIPIVYVYIKKEKRIDRFEAQLPEAMDMLARSLKAGHAFTGGLQMVGQEFPDPVGTEFSKTLDEINFGVAYEDALRNLSSRIDSDDLKLFVISVIIQRTSGGNLAEILENIGRLIRERFKLKGNVRTLTAEGRISAYILLALPFFLGYVMYLLNPKYISVLFTDPIGHFMLAGAGVMMIIGAFVMKRMVDIKV